MDQGSRVSYHCATRSIVYTVCGIMLAAARFTLLLLTKRVGFPKHSPLAIGVSTRDRLGQVVATHSIHHSSRESSPHSHKKATNIGTAARAMQCHGIAHAYIIFAIYIYGTGSCSSSSSLLHPSILVEQHNSISLSLFLDCLALHGIMIFEASGLSLMHPLSIH